MARSDPRRRIQCWSLSTTSVDKWLKRSHTGEKLVYAHGELEAELGAHLRLLATKGEVSLHHGRGEDGATDYYAVRNRIRVTLPPRPRRQAGPVLTANMSAVFLRLKAEARQGLRCSSDKVLGDALGLTADQVKWAIRQLVAAELIHTRIEPTPCEPKYRVVTIVSTGLETRPPNGGSR